MYLSGSAEMKNNRDRSESPIFTLTLKGKGKYTVRKERTFVSTENDKVQKIDSA